MPSYESETDLSDFDHESRSSRQALPRHESHLTGMHWVILGVSVVVTLAAWQFSDSLLQRRTADLFERDASLVVELLKGHLSNHEDLLLAGVAATLTHTNGMSRKQWRKFASTLNLDQRHPGMNGIGVIREVSPHSVATFETRQRTSWPDFEVFPDHDFPTKLPIVYIEPAENNAAAIGLDVAFEENRREAALLARDLGTTQISEPITLVQDTNQSPGFLFYAPYYRDDIGFAGLVFAAVLVEQLVQGVLEESNRHLRLAIHDEDALLYDDFPNGSGSASEDSRTFETEENLYGRRWRMTLGSTASAVGTSSLPRPIVVLLSGLTLNALLFVMFLLLVRTNRRALKQSDTLTQRLARQATTLAARNSELERFAYVASHDLKTPLRAIDNLTAFMSEDIDEYIEHDKTRKIMLNHTHRITEQVERSFSLIQAVLEFSVIGREAFSLKRVDSGLLIAQIGENLNIDATRLVIDKDLPILHTCPAHLSQVFENLIGNAIKYHPSPKSATVTVTVAVQERYYRFFVTDDGEGIEVKYHERIFRPFTTLQQNPVPTSSGIGLSIVRKSVECLGGSSGILASTHQGSTFYFDWPIEHSATENEAHAA